MEPTESDFQRLENQINSIHDSILASSIRDDLAKLRTAQGTVTKLTLKDFQKLPQDEQSTYMKNGGELSDNGVYGPGAPIVEPAPEGPSMTQKQFNKLSPHEQSVRVKEPGFEIK